MKRITAHSVFIIALCTATAAWAQALPRAEPGKVGLSAERLERIEQAFSREIDGGKLPGAVIMVARDGQLAYTKTIGYRDKGANAPLAEDSIFRIYSMTKPLVSVAAMILMEEGRLQLPDPVFKYLPEFAKLQVSVPQLDPYGKVTYSTVPAERPVTVQDLLRHTAGLGYGEITQNEAVKAAYAEAGSYNPDGMAYDSRAVSAEDQVADLGRAPLARQPGTQWEYSLSTDVLGRVVERVAGQLLGLDRGVRRLLDGGVEGGLQRQSAEVPRLLAGLGGVAELGRGLQSAHREVTELWVI